jgi:predicted amidohydrolase YtcJ
MVNVVSADLVLLDGKILTMNPLQPTAEAIAVKGERIIQVGSTKDVSNLIVKGTKIIRLKGKTAVPGIIDTHIHVADFGRILSWLNIENTSTIQELQDCLRQRINQTAKGKWIIGRGWDENRLAEKRFPTRFDLDSVSSDNPVILYHLSRQVCVVNSRASELAGIAKQSSADVEKNQAGEFTGVLRDAATNLVWNVIPAPTLEELTASAALACQKIVEAGITSIHWIILSPIEISVIQKLNDQNKLPLRVNVIAPANLFDEILALKQNLKDDMLRFGGFEIFADGYLAAKTAALTEPYSDSPAEKGQLLCPTEEIVKLAIKISEAGFQLVIHAVGDKAVEAALNVIEQTQRSNAEKDLRLRIEQAALLNEKLLERMKNQQVVVSVQPRVIASEFSVWSAVKRLGLKRAKYLFPLKRLIENGVPVIAGSDCPMEPLNPMLGIQEAVAREAFPEERVSVDAALRMYTMDAAYSSFEENLKGSIEVGKLADITVLSVDLRTALLDRISEIEIEITIIGGQVIHSK